MTLWDKHFLNRERFIATILDTGDVITCIDKYCS